MKRTWLLLGAAAVAALSASAWAADKYPIQVVPVGKGPYTFPEGYKTPWDKVQIMVTEKLSPNLYVLHGNAGPDSGHPDASGGRAAVLFGPDGVLMVDTENEPVAEKTLKAIRTFTQAPIKIVVSSHAHGDHTGGNAFFAKQGAILFSQENLRDELARPPARANGQPTPAVDPASLATVTYQYDPATEGKPAVTIHMNGETVDFIPMMPSHMGGDTVVRFHNADVIYIEDFYRNFGYPFADQANGGSINGMLKAIDLLEKLADDNTILVPGHGTLVHRKDLLPYRNMLVEVLAKVKTLRGQGKSLKDVLAMNLTAPYDKTTLGDSQSSKDRFISEVYNEVNGLPPVVDGKRKMPASF
ncbi:MAG TPA: MBL fold metallo-hydrolase [Rhizomicrobium sp.]|jgi:cyclase|nr:MBL fold metallo-hydrolase [Rhizomicrobium sp.]